MKKLIPILFLACLLQACGHSNSEARDQDAFAARVKSAPEFSSIDNDLDVLESETAELEKKYDDIQQRVLDNTSFAEAASLTATQIIVHVNDNNVLIVNDEAMSKNDFSTFLDKNLPALCSPTPHLSIDKKADYDTAAWVLEAIYSHGCSSIDIE